MLFSAKLFLFRFKGHFMTKSTQMVSEFFNCRNEFIFQIP